MKSIRLFLVSVLTAFAFMAMPQDACAEMANGTCGKNVKWSINNDSILIISGTGKMDDYEVTTENYVEYSNTPWKEYADLIVGVVIQEGVTNVGKNCFLECNHLRSLRIPASVTILDPASIFALRLESIEIDSRNTKYDSRNNCNAIVETATNTLLRGCQKSTIPNSVTKIAKKAFFQCYGLAEITIPNSVTAIEDSAFCITFMKTLTIPKSVKSIGKAAFSKNWYLKMLVFEGGSTTVGDSAFFDSNVLELVESSNTISSIGNGAFRKCSSLKAFTIGDNVVGIGDDAFRDCSMLSRLSFGKSVKTIGANAFNNCGSLTGVTLGNAVESIGKSAFVNCRKLATVNFGTSVQSIGDNCFGNTVLTSVALPKTIRTIGENAFSYVNTIQSLTVDNAPVEIGNWAFASCTEMKTVSLGNSAKKIGERAFYFCSALTTVTIPSTMTNIGEYAFYLISNLSSVTIASQNVKIEKEAFGSCSALRTLTYAEGVKTAVSTGVASITKVNLPSTLTTIGENAFKGLSIASITIPPSVTSIKEGAFMQCNKLTSITLPDKLTEIGKSAFYYCSALTSLTIPASVKTMGESAFMGCYGLTTVTLGSGLTKISDSAFNNCYALASINFPNTITEIGASAFYDTSLRSVVLPSSLTTLGTRAFCSCAKLTSVKFPESLTTIGDNCFMNCTSLTEINLPASLKSIGESAFYSCKNITTITSNAVTPPTAGNGAFLTNNLYNTTLYVPAQSVEAYKTAANWQGKYLGAVKPLETKGSIADGTCGTNLLWYITSDSVLVISGKGDMDDYTIEYNSYGDYYYTTAPWRTYTIKGIEIADGVTSVGNAAFFDRGDDVKTVVLPSTLVTMGEYAFYYCTALKSVELPKYLTLVGDYAFYGCRSIDKPLYTDRIFIHMPATFKGDYMIPGAIREIKPSAFESCSGLTAIYIPGSVKTIGEYAFAECTGLKTTVVPSSVTSIGRYAFGSCTGKLLLDCDIEDGYINSNNSAVSPLSNSSFNEVVLGETVSKVGFLAFSFAEQMEKITILGKETQLADGAFYGCSALKTMVNYGVKPADLDEDVFTGVSQSKGTLYVPATSLSQYKSADYWKEWGTILPLTEDIIAKVEPSAPAPATTQTIHDLSGKPLTAPTKGINIINGRKVLVR